MIWRLNSTSLRKFCISSVFGVCATLWVWRVLTVAEWHMLCVVLLYTKITAATIITRTAPIDRSGPHMTYTKYTHAHVCVLCARWRSSHVDADAVVDDEATKYESIKRTLVCVFSGWFKTCCNLKLMMANCCTVCHFTQFDVCRLVGLIVRIRTSHKYIEFSKRTMPKQKQAEKRIST